MSRYLGLHDLDGTPLLVLDDGVNLEPFLVTGVDLGAPDVRETVQDNAGADGTTDSTRFVGGSAVTVELTAVGDASGGPQMWLDRLRCLCHPDRRLFLQLQVDGWAGPRRLLVRGAPVPRPLTDVEPDVQFQWKAPSGLLQDTVPTSVVLSPSGPVSGGIDVPTLIPTAVVGGPVVGAGTINVGGNRTAPPTFAIFGPCTSPLLRLVDTGEQLSFPGLVIAAGDYLWVDVETRQVLLNGDPAQSRYNRLDFAASSWWWLPAGAGTAVLFTATGTAPPCQTVLTVYPRWI